MVDVGDSGCRVQLGSHIGERMHGHTQEQMHTQAQAQSHTPDTFLESVSAEDFSAFLLDPAAKFDPFVGGIEQESGALGMAQYIEPQINGGMQSYAPHQAAPALRESASFSIQQGKFLQPMGIFVGGPAEYNRTHALPATPSTHGHHSYGNPQLGFLPHPITQSGQPIFRPQPVHENEDDDHRKAIADKRRSDRNLREQRRSLKISQQIDQLKAILQNSGVDVKANKSNILSGVAEYIQRLQRRTMELDRERIHWQKLRSPENDSTSERTIHPVPQEGHDGGSMLNDMDFKNVFMSGCVPMALAHLDGRILECNYKFESVSGYTRAQLNQLTVFNLLHPDELQDTFSAVGELLNSSSGSGECRRRACLPGCKMQPDLVLSLVRDSASQRPRYFHVLLSGGITAPDMHQRAFARETGQRTMPHHIAKQEKTHGRDSVGNDETPHFRTAQAVIASTSGEWTRASPPTHLSSSTSSGTQESSFMMTEDGEEIATEAETLSSSHSLHDHKLDEPPMQIRRKNELDRVV